MYLKIVKIAAGAALAMSLAEMLELNFAVSAGIIVLLSIQDTKKETAKTAGRRFGAFVIMLVLSGLFFHLLGYHFWVFGIFLFCFTTICTYLKWVDAISMNAVVATHFLTEQSYAVPVVINELLVFLIGIGIAMLFNLYMPSHLKEIRKTQKKIEDIFQGIFEHMAEYILKEERSLVDSFYYKEPFRPLEDLLTYLEKKAYHRLENSFTKEDRYFLKYVKMRESQLYLIKEIDEDILALTNIPSQAADLSKHFLRIAELFHECNNAQELLEENNELLKAYRKMPLPVTREEFENRAILYQILRDTEQLLWIKYEFSNSLEEKERKNYWNEIDKK